LEFAKLGRTLPATGNYGSTLHAVIEPRAAHHGQPLALKVEREPRHEAPALPFVSTAE